MFISIDVKSALRHLKRASAFLVLYRYSRRTYQPCFKVSLQEIFSNAVFSRLHVCVLVLIDSKTTFLCRSQLRLKKGKF